MSGAHQSPVWGSALWKTVGVLISWRRFIIFNLLVATALVVTVSLLLPRWYRATASILPSNEPDVFSSLGAARSLLMGLAPAGALKGAGGSSGAYNYVAILESRGTMERVVRKFGLISAYDISDSSMEKAVQMLSGNVSFEIQGEENILIGVLDQDPNRAAAMANTFVDLLNDASRQLGTTEGRNNREFIGKRLERTREALRAAEDSLQKYQERTGMIFIPGRRAASVAPIAELYGLKAMKEVESAILKRSNSGESPAIKRLELELRELNKKIGTFPGIGATSLRFYREVAIRQKILEFLLPVYEQAKINEQKDVPVILVLDRAVTPERAVKPNRVLIIFLASSVILEILIVLAFVMHGILRHAPAAALEVGVRRAVLQVARRYRITFGM